MLIKSPQQFCAAGLPANITVSKQGLVAVMILRGNEFLLLKRFSSTARLHPAE